jgi:hypothetical protein
MTPLAGVGVIVDVEFGEDALGPSDDVDNLEFNLRGPVTADQVDDVATVSVRDGLPVKDGRCDPILLVCTPRVVLRVDESEVDGWAADSKWPRASAVLARPAIPVEGK